jgi:O-antigen ligase
VEAFANGRPATDAAPATTIEQIRALVLVKRRSFVLLAVIAVAGLAAAGAGATEGAAIALFAAGVVVGSGVPLLAAAYLALVLPVGFSITSLGGVNVPLLHAAAAGVATGYGLRLMRARARPALGLADAAFLVLVVFVVASGAGPASTSQWFHDVVIWASLCVVFYCCTRELVDRLARRAFYLGLATAALIEAGYAIAQFISASHSRFTRLEGAIVYPQPKATLQHANSLGGFLVLAFFLVLGGALAARGPAVWAWLAVAAIVLVGIVAPFSRGAWVSLLGGLVGLLVVERRHRRVVGGASAALLAAAGAAALADRGAVGARITSIFSHDNSTLYGFRATLVRRAADAIAAHPLTGAGRFVEHGIYAGRPTIATHPHDLLLGVAVFFGIPAAVAFTSLLILALRAAWTASRDRRARVAGEGAGVFAALVALLVNGVFEYPFWNATMTVEIVLLVILAVALGRDVEEHSAGATAAVSVLRDHPEWTGPDVSPELVLVDPELAERVRPDG